jgi:hypothetical protein
MNYGLFIKFYHRFRPLRPAASSLLYSFLIGPHQPATFSPLILRVASAHSTSVHMPGMAQPFAWNTTQTIWFFINVHTVFLYFPSVLQRTLLAIHSLGVFLSAPTILSMFSRSIYVAFLPRLPRLYLFTPICTRCRLRRSFSCPQGTTLATGS